MTVNLWNPVMKKGIIEFIRPEQCSIHKPLHDMKMKVFEDKKNFSCVEENVEVC